MKYKTPLHWLEEKFGPDKANWNLSFNWRDGFVRTLDGTCPNGHILTTKNRDTTATACTDADLTLKDGSKVCLACRFSPGDLVITIYPLAGFVGVIQWVKDVPPSFSIRLLDDFTEKGYSCYDADDWYWVIPTGKKVENLAFEPVDYFGSLVEQFELPFFPPKRMKRKKKMVTDEEKIIKALLKTMPKEDLAKLLIK